MQRQDTRDGSLSSSEDVGRPSKRKRVALACGLCRERKIRCDGRKPICSQCTKRGDGNCVYAVLANSAKRLSEQEYITCLQRQVQELQRTVDGYEKQNGGETTGSTVEGLEHQEAIRFISSNSSRKRSLRTLQSSNTPSSGSANQAAHKAALTSPEAIQEQGRSFDADTGQSQSGHWQECHSDDYEDDDSSPVGAMGVAMIVDEPSSLPSNGEFYGKSSVLSLLQDVSQPKPQGRKQAVKAGSLSNTTSGAMGGQHRGRMSSMLGPCYALPPREVADKLFNIFFSNVHIFYPWVHSPSVREVYDLPWTGSTDQQTAATGDLDIGLGGSNCEKSIFFCSLNAMFALGCEFSDLPPQEKETASAMFHDRMKALLYLELFDRGTISHVQALLLVAHSLLCSQYPSRCWNLVGLACRMAVGLGLQSDKSTEQLTQVETEIRRRIWYGCLQMDMTVSMTLGRSPSVRAFNEVPLPSAIDDEYLSVVKAERHQPEDIPSQNSFNVVNIKLARLLGMILDNIYHATSKENGLGGVEEKTVPSRHEDFSTITSLDSLLDELTNGLPTELQRGPNTERRAQGGVHAILRRQSNVLHARVLHLKILLYRPSFSAYCAAARSQFQSSRREQLLSSGRNLNSLQESQFLMSLRVPCAVACVKTTCELVRSIERARMEKSTGAWWYSLFYLITCGVILIMSECTDSLKPHLDPNELQAAWESCIKILSQMSENHCRVAGYLQTLMKLRERTSRFSSDGVQHSEAYLASGTRSGTVELDAFNTFAVQDSAGKAVVDPHYPDSRSHYRDQSSRYPYDQTLNSDAENMSENIGHFGHPTQCYHAHPSYATGVTPLLDNWEGEFETARVMFPADVFDALDLGFPFSS